MAGLVVLLFGTVHVTVVSLVPTDTPPEVNVSRMIVMEAVAAFVIFGANVAMAGDVPV